MKVVAVSGVSGCGKTTLIKHLSKLYNSPYLLFDDFADKTTYPQDMKLWFNNGANLNDIKIEKFENALLKRLADNTANYVFIEEPFGRNRPAISSFIDYVILLDQPMEVCLSRVITRNIAQNKTDPVQSISNYLAMYNDYFREIYIELTNNIRSNCDVIIDQVMPVETTARIISNWLEENEQHN